MSPNKTTTRSRPAKPTPKTPRRRLIQLERVRGAVLHHSRGCRRALRLRRLLAGRRELAAVPARAGERRCAMAGCFSRDASSSGGPSPGLPGLMYDGATDSWLVRETGIMVEVPEIWGHVFVGRTKEGFSLNKVMVGYAGWTMERATISDATIPILADGVKWLGLAPKLRLVLERRHLRRLVVGGAVVLELRPSGRGSYGMAAGVQGTDEASSRHEPALREARRGRAAASLAAGELHRAVLRRDRQVPRQQHEDGGHRGLLPPGSVAVGSEYFFQHVKATESGDPDVPRGRRRRHLARHRRDARLQHARRVLQSGVTGAHGLRRWTWCVGARGTLLLHRPRRVVAIAAAGSGG